jgi:hypothetical protein
MLKWLAAKYIAVHSNSHTFCVIILLPWLNSIVLILKLINTFNFAA